MNRELTSLQYAEALAWFIYKNSDTETPEVEPKKEVPTISTVDAAKELFFQMAK